MILTEKLRGGGLKLLVLLIAPVMALGMLLGFSTKPAIAAENWENIYSCGDATVSSKNCGGSEWTCTWTHDGSYGTADNSPQYHFYKCTWSGGSSGGSGGSNNGYYPGSWVKTDAVLNFDCESPDPNVDIDFQGCPDYQKYTALMSEGWHTFDIPAAVPTSPTYDFDGWAEYSSDYDPYEDPTPETPDIDQIYPAGGQVSVALNSALTLHAIWKKARPKLIYMSNTSNGNVSISRSGDVGATATIADPATDPAMRETFKASSGMKFAGWNTDPSGKGKTYQAGDSFTYPDRNVTLYAQWAPIVSSMPETGGNSSVAVLGAALFLAVGFCLSQLRLRN